MTLSEYAYKTFGNPGEYQINLKRFYPDRKIFEMIPGLRNPFYFKSIKMHPLLHKPFENVLFDIAMAGLGEEIKDYYGCFIIRLIEGTDIFSSHSWGLAVDINVKENPRGQKPIINMKIVEIFEKHGFVWGGRFKIPDGHHFEASIKLLKGEL